MTGLLLALVVVLAIVLVGLVMSCLVLAKIADQIASDFTEDDRRRLERMKAGQS
jgi:uncharacterized protein involved in cysteine biosynthesis